MATVATGMPLGICTVDKRASMPLRGPPSPGTPITGRTVLEATAPAKCAANPAIAMKTFVPPDSHSLI